MLLTSLSDNVSVTLPDDLLWIDEHSWTPPVATISYLLTGALLVESAVRQAGRPITLVSLSDMAWVTRQTVDILYAWATHTQRQLLLRISHTRTFNVLFRHQEVPIDAEPVLGYPSQRSSDYFRITIRLQEAFR